MTSTTADDDDLEAEFALFEQKIATVSVSLPPPTHSPESLQPQPHPQPHPHPLPHPRPQQPRTLPLLPSRASHQKATPSHPLPHQNSNSHPPSQPPRTGKWKWTGTEWKWQPELAPLQTPPNVTLQTPSLTTQQPPNENSILPTAHPFSHSTDGVPASESAKPHKLVKRTAAGEKWMDTTLLDWPENDHRIFVGDLAPDAAEKDLEKAFSRYPSFNMARVVREKRSGLCKGYGFVSFAKGGDMVAALKEMNGKYVGNRPVKLRKSNWQKRSMTTERGKELKLMREIVKK